MSRKIRTESIDSLVARYAAAAADHQRGSDDSDPKPTNRAARSIAAIYRELRRRGPDAQRSLLPLLSHPDPGVRVWAGAHALEFAPAEGEPVLIELSRMPKGLTGFSAEITLKVWREGELRFP